MESFFGYLIGLDNVWNQKPLLDGKVIMAELGLTKGGPKIKEWVNLSLSLSLSRK